MDIGQLLMGYPQASPGIPYPMPNTLQQPIPAPHAPEPVQPQGFVQQLMARLQDPAVQQGLFAAGTTLMQNPGFGQNGWDLAAQALTTGANTVQNVRELTRKRRLEDEDRMVADTERKAKNRREDRQVAVSEQNANTYANTAGSQAWQGEQRLKLAEKELEEMKRANESRERIQQKQLEIDRIRATAYSNGTASGGQTPAKVQLVNMLAEQYKAEGMDPTAAQARAVEALEIRSASRSPAETARRLYENAVNGYNNSIEGLQRPLTREQAAEMLQTAMDEAQRIHALDGPVNNPPGVGRSGVVQRPTAARVETPTPPAPAENGAPTTAPAPKSGVPTVDAGLSQRVATARAAGYTDDQIRQFLQSQGIDPKKAGL